MSSNTVMLGILLAGVFLVSAVYQETYGHGLGADVAPPISFQGMNVTVSTTLDPYDITVGEIDDANMSVRFFDKSTNTTLQAVTYRVEVWRSEDLLARHLFFDEDGILDVEIRPVDNCSELELWRCTEYYGSEHIVAPGALFAFGRERPVIKGPIFDQGGLYNIKVDIESATSPKSLLSETLSYDTFVSVAQEQNFVVEAYAEEFPVTVKTYYDEVYNFDYDAADDSISFDMPFDWTPEYVELVQLVHEEVSVPSSFAPYANGASFDGYVNGIKITNNLRVDPFTDSERSILHFILLKKDLQRINDEIGSSNYEERVMSFELVPRGSMEKISTEFNFVDGEGAPIDTVARVMWDPQYGAGDIVPLEIVFFDADGNLLRDAKYAYNIFDESDEIIADGGLGGEEIGLDAIEGIDVLEVLIEEPGRYRIDVALLGVGLGVSEGYAGIGSGILELGIAGTAGSTAAEDPRLAVKAAEESPETAAIPDWIRQNAGWWADGTITDADFVAGIEYLIQNEIIRIDAASSNNIAASAIPDWIRQNAGWWADGTITDADFVAGLKYLIEQGIITV